MILEENQDLLLENMLLLINIQDLPVQVAGKCAGIRRYIPPVRGEDSHRYLCPTPVALAGKVEVITGLGQVGQDIIRAAAQVKGDNCRFPRNIYGLLHVFWIRSSRDKHVYDDCEGDDQSNHENH